MDRKSFWAVACLLVIIAALAAAVLFYKGPVAPAPADTTNSSATPNLGISPTTPGSPVFGTYISSTPTSVTVKAQDGTNKTFTISAGTPVISTVEAGVVAGGLKSLKAGAQIVVIPNPADVTAATNIQLVTQPPAPPALPAGSIFVTFLGTVVSHTATSVVVKKQSDNLQVTVALTKNTKIISNVPAGQTGKGLSYLTNGSTYVNIQAVQTGSNYSASVVQILVPITNAPAL